MEKSSRRAAEDFANRLPTRVRKALYTNPEWEEMPHPQELLSKMRKPGAGLFIFGPPGTGKTLYAAQLTYLMLQYRPTGKLRIREALFVQTPRLLQELRQSYQDGTQGMLRSFDHYCHTPWLVLDDLSVEKTTDWAFEMMYLILDYRYNEFKNTVITSNLSLSALASRWDDRRLVSRIRGMCEIMKMTGEDRR